MSALLAPLLVASFVLCCAGVAKLRSPAGAVNALRAAGLPASDWIIRAFAALELVLGGFCVVSPGRLGAGLMSALYAMFASLSLLLARRQSECGCFGAARIPASPLQSVLSAALALVALLAALSPPPTVWSLAAGSAAIVLIAAAGAAYATVIAYTQLPAAWEAWSPR